MSVDAFVSQIPSSLAVWPTWRTCTVSFFQMLRRVSCVQSAPLDLHLPIDMASARISKKLSPIPNPVIKPDPMPPVPRCLPFSLINNQHEHVGDLTCHGSPSEEALSYPDSLADLHLSDPKPHPQPLSSPLAANESLPHSG